MNVFFDHFLVFSLIYFCVSLRFANGNDLCGLRTNDLIELRGYVAEEHKVITEDDYILTIFRCNSKIPCANKKKAIFVQHALLSSSDDYCIDHPNYAMAYILADAGYDVWLGNSRGNFYSKQNLEISNTNRQFWDFTWYEMGIYDHPAVIDYILNVTCHQKLYYIGHSQGTTSLMVLLTEKPEYNKKIHAASFMAPVAYMKNSGILYQTAAKFEWFLKLFKNREFLARGTSIDSLVKTVCTFIGGFCENSFDFFFGPSRKNINQTLYPSYLCYWPSGASVNCFDHYVLETKYGYFGKYNDRSHTNFDLSRISIPIQLHYSRTDTIVSPIDVKRLISELINCHITINYIHEIKFNHLDYFWSMDAAPYVYAKTLTFFEEIQKNVTISNETS